MEFKQIGIKLTLSRIGHHVGQEIAKKLVNEYKVRKLIDQSDNRSEALVAFVNAFGMKLVSELFRDTDTKIKVGIESEGSKVQFEFRTNKIRKVEWV